MKRLVLIALLLIPSQAFAQKSNWFSTKAQQEFQKSLTDASYFGVPRYTTVLLPTCNTANKGAVAFDTTAGGVVSCNGTVWLAGGGAAASVTPGTTTVGSSTNCFMYSDGTSVLRCSSAFLLANDTGAGDGLFGFRKTSTAGAGITNNFWGVSGTLTNTAAITWGSQRVYTATAGSSPTQIGAERIQLGAGYTGTALSFALYGLNSSASTGTAFLSDTPATGVIGHSAATTTGTVVGVRGTAQNGDISVGVVGWSNTTKNAGKNVGVFGSAANSGTTPFVIGGYFWLATTEPTIDTSAALLADNVGAAVPIAFFRDNSAALPTTAATATTAILDGGWLQNGNGVLTNATMAAETQALNSGAMIHSYTWTNAQVTALPTTAGDITVATLPAKTGVRNAYVVITGAAVGPTTVTVSCGDAIGGTPFINYIVPSDAKAAANTVYGDAVAERGTSIDVEFYYLPSYTATTLVTCHFISTGANLSTVTGSTGRVVLETFFIPR